MCSISGIFSTVRNREHVDAVARMNAAQRHRGPDDRGILECDPARVVLGNTRLAIIDTSAAGHQPMRDPENGNAITYNGEVYNFKDLRREIDSDWTSKTDTEVVLRAYNKLGTDAFRKLRGMFALAIWDHAKEQLILARDPLGIKPLYYYVTTNHLLFASELRALLASSLIPKRLSRDGVDSYLANGSVAAPLTVIDGVQQLMPGQYLRVNQDALGAIEVSTAGYAGLDHKEPVAQTRSDAVARLRSELEESLQLHLVSDVPLGVFLSGGMDSSAIVALMGRVTDERPKTFSVVFNETGFTEAPFSRAVAERFQTDHFEIRLSEDRLLDLLPDSIAAIDQPTMDGINTFVVSQAVKQAGVTVALSGLGGDELFAGYPSFRRALRVGSVSRTSRRVLKAAAGVGQVALNGSVQRHKFWQLVKSEGTPEDVYRISRQLFAEGAVAELTGRNVESSITNGKVPDADVVNVISRLELNGYMTNTLLRDTDAMSMAHSLEVRVPFVDVNVVDYVLSLPGKWKLRAGSQKALLADALADLLPRDFLARPKMGFTLPFEKWLQQNLRSEVSSLIADERLLSNAFLSPKTVQKVWTNFLAKPRAVGWTRPWSLYVLAKWCEVNGVAA